ncbi:MAG: 50S ribosomal protein L1 [Chloroflexi bacterium]|jgi:large subunit ribosomal protein L1|nr:MAG: 50S ribosomal protein L1 [Chloroflexi bacterium OLB13]MBC6954767.1 50S ribosomal protein L1 [Chloroflexota bacterium]MBV6436168.1 50S ribosomal protein L1 [Anaerolineae bacterium]MDL1915783.1 50S ribosomal protein L1 [Anaerolineae bacterium CFX4]MBW7879610.1 50S ribosomal protein L1 [Anaerolineae bacterium]
MAGKRFTAAVKQIDRQKNYPLNDALALVKKFATDEATKHKFDETIELHFRLGIDPRHSDQQVRSTVLLPAGLGKKVRVLVFAEGDDARAAEAAGADIVADDQIVNKIATEGWTDFDATLATPAMMKKIGRIARVLGPRGLMPNPKAGTVVEADDLARAVEELKAGRVEFRNDKTGNVHVPIGKASFTLEQLQQNAEAVFAAIEAQKPSATKGIYMKRAVVCSTMSPGLRLELSSSAVTAK